MITAHVSIDGERFWLGEGLLGLKLTLEYGFVASQLSADFDLAPLVGRVPSALRRKAQERVPFDAGLVFQDGRSEAFSGFLEDNTGRQQLRKQNDAKVTLSGRSVLAKLLDDFPAEGGRVTKAYSNERWGRVVADIAKTRGFRADGILPSSVYAGTQLPDGTWFYSADNLLPGEIINQAVGATGFIANVDSTGLFRFIPEVIQHGMPPEFEFKAEDDASTIEEFNFANGKVNQFRSRVQFLKTDPGTSVRLLIHQTNAVIDGYLSGLYKVTRVAYSINEETDAFVFFSDVDVAEKLPVLGGANRE